MRLTPYELSVLFHHYVSPAPYEFGIESGLYAETFEKFVRLDVFTSRGSPEQSIVTDLGKAWCKAILLTPLPREVFIDSHDNIIE